MQNSAHDDQLIERNGQMMRDSVQQMVVSSETPENNETVIEVVDYTGENQLLADNAHEDHLIERDGQTLMGIVQQLAFISDGEKHEPAARTTVEKTSPTGNEPHVTEPEKILNGQLYLANAVHDIQSEGLASR